MCISLDGKCGFCGRDFHGELKPLSLCQSDDCPSHDDLVAVLDEDGKHSYFCVVFNGEDYQAVFPESLAEWSLLYTTHADCKAYLTRMVYCLTLWAGFGDIPTREDDDEIDQDWLAFPEGTDRFEIWHWFEHTFSVSIGRELQYFTAPELLVITKPTYQIVFDQNHYAPNQELEKVVEPDFFSLSNGYNISDLDAVLDMPINGEIKLDYGNQQVTRLS